MRGEGTTTGAARHLDRDLIEVIDAALHSFAHDGHLGHQHAAALLEPLVEAALDGGELLRGHLRREAAHLRSALPRKACTCDDSSSSFLVRASTWLVIASLVVVIDSKLASSCLRMLSERSACIPG